LLFKITFYPPSSLIVLFYDLFPTLCFVFKTWAENPGSDPAELPTASP